MQKKMKKCISKMHLKKGGKMWLKNVKKNEKLWKISENVYICGQLGKHMIFDWPFLLVQYVLNSFDLLPYTIENQHVGTVDADICWYLSQDIWYRIMNIHNPQIK